MARDASKDGMKPDPGRRGDLVRVAEGVDLVARELVGLTAIALAASEPDLTLVQYRMLVLLLENGSLSQASLGDLTGRTPSTVSRTIRRLERRGLLTRTRDSIDQRKLSVALTDEGLQLTSSVLTARSKMIAERLSILDPERLAGIEAGVQGLLRALKC